MTAFGHLTRGRTVRSLNFVMYFTILDESSRSVIARSAAAGLILLPLVRFVSLGDPFQAPRFPVASALLAVMFLFAPVAAARSRVRPWVSWALLLFAVLVAASACANGAFAAVWGVQGRMQGLVSVGILLLAAAAGSWMPRNAPRLIARTAVVAVSVESVLLLSQTFSGAVPVGTFGNRAIAAYWLVVAFALVVGLGVVERGGWRIASVAAAFIGAFSLGVTGTRSAWIAAAVCAVVIISVIRTRGRRNGSSLLRTVARALAASLLFGIVIFAGALTGDVESRAKADPGSLAAGSAVSRLEIWRDTTAMVSENPFLGVGPGRFIYEYPLHESLQHARAEGPDVRADQAHSMVLQVAAEGGVAAAIVLYGLAVWALACGVRSARGGDGAALLATVAFATYLSVALFSVPALETDVVGWALGGFVASTRIPRGSRGDERRAALPSRALCGIIAIAISMASLSHLVAVRRWTQSVELFNRADFSGASERAEAAVSADPLTDVFRVAAADAAMYRDEAAKRRALQLVERGIELEPGSYDLLIARARLLSSLGVSSAEVADAYRAAVRRYPLGVTVRREAVDALTAAGHEQEARDMARGLLELVPDGRGTGGMTE